jgi:hypothetical protein
MVLGDSFLFSMFYECLKRRDRQFHLHLQLANLYKSMHRNSLYLLIFFLFEYNIKRNNI